MPKLGQMDLFLGDIFTFIVCQGQKSITGKSICCLQSHFLYLYMCTSVLEANETISSVSFLKVVFSNFSIYSKCQISLEIFCANACLPALGNLLYHEFPVFILKQHNAKVHVHASEECNKLTS